MKTYLILITLFCFITCQNPDQAFYSNSLSLEQSNKLKKRIYADYKKDILLSRAKEMTDQVITINNRQIKFDMQFLHIKHYDSNLNNF